MKFKRLEIQNFRAISNLILEDLEDIVLIVGQNGVGKSSIFDAIRLLKSSYGGYQGNEWQNWFNEFQIQINKGINYDLLLRDLARPLIINATIRLSDSERKYLQENSESIIDNFLWKSLSHNVSTGPFNFTNQLSFASNTRQNREKILAEKEEALRSLQEHLEKNELTGHIEIFKDRQPIVKNNVTLEILFTTYNPEQIGVIDYHGAHRDYQKENIHNLNINFSDYNEQRSGTALYNYKNKYNNIKAEMASSYVRAMIAKESGEEKEAINSLNNSLKLLFETFFTDKKFKGIIPSKNGTLSFPVELKTGHSHDIAELSSGEKEVLFGYLRLRNQAPRNSIILIDEPELHLNPRLAKKLPEFYYKSISQELNNQIWLVTHSDTILKESVGLHGFSVYHMIDANSELDNQVRKISIKKDIEAALIDLFGDISSYQSGNKVVIFEGQDSEFDKYMCNSLFPEFEKNINSISAGSKSNVNNLQKVLKKASDEGIINKRFISIVDRDADKKINKIDTLQFSWDVYHIENYLLNEVFILKVLEDLGHVHPDVNSTDKIEEVLREIAVEQQNSQVEHYIREYVQKETKKCLVYEADSYLPYEVTFHTSVLTSIENLKKGIEKSLSIESILGVKNEIVKKLSNSLKTSEWKKEFRGKQILNRFASRYANGLRQEQFKNLIISKMKLEKFHPSGMKEIINSILEI